LQLASLITQKVLDEKIFYYSVLESLFLEVRICNEKGRVPFKKFKVTLL